MMNRNTGQRIGLLADIKQSIDDILTTPLGSRVMRELYGSFLFELIDQPGNATGVMRMIAATYDAITRWEPRVILDMVNVVAGKEGATVVRLSGRIAENNESFDHAVLLRRAA